MTALLYHYVITCHLDSYVFWIDCCRTPGIGRVGMDGSEPRVLIQTDLDAPTALTVDHISGRIYWIDRNRVSFCSMDGLQRNRREDMNLPETFVHVFTLNTPFRVKGSSLKGPQ